MKTRDRRGATAVEMAVVSSVLFVIVVGGIELSRVSMLRHTADYGAYLGARVGIISGAKASDIEARVQQHLSKVGVKNAHVVVTPSTITEETQKVRVDVSIPAANNSWVVPKRFTGALIGSCTLLTERSALVMSEALSAPPPPAPPLPPPTFPPPPPMPPVAPPPFGGLPPFGGTPPFGTPMPPGGPTPPPTPGPPPPPILL